VQHKSILYSETCQVDYLLMLTTYW